MIVNKSSRLQVSALIPTYFAFAAFLTKSVRRSSTLRNTVMQKKSEKGFSVTNAIERA